MLYITCLSMKPGMLVISCSLVRYMSSISQFPRPHIPFSISFTHASHSNPPNPPNPPLTPGQLRSLLHPLHRRNIPPPRRALLPSRSRSRSRSPRIPLRTPPSCTHHPRRIPRRRRRRRRLRHTPRRPLQLRPPLQHANRPPRPYRLAAQFRR